MRTHVNNGGHKSDAGRWRGCGTIAHPLEEVQSLVGGVLTTAIVIPLVAWAAGWTGHWFTSKVSPEEYLSAVVDIPSPAGRCNGWVFDKDPQHLPGVLPDDDLDDLDAWAAANGGIPASGNDVVVTLQGLNGHTVVVNSITVDVVSRTEPPHGTYPKTLLPCGGPLVPYRFQADLDATPVSVTAVADDPAVAEGQARRPVDLPHAISGSEPEVWYLAAVTNTCTCEWTATLNWTSEGNEGHTNHRQRPPPPGSRRHARHSCGHRLQRPVGDFAEVIAGTSWIRESEDQPQSPTRASDPGS